MSEHIEKMVQVYKFNGSGVRVVMIGEDPWFVAKDVCDILGTRTDSVRKIIGDKRVKSIIPNLVGDNGRGHGKDILIINEAGLYSLVMQSRKPDAEAFQNWVVEDVLPSIRKTGMYMMHTSAGKTDPAMLDRIIDRLVEERERARELEIEREMMLEDLDLAIVQRDNAIKQQNLAMQRTSKALIQRDEAIRQRGKISRHREATALQRNSVLSRRVNALTEAKMLIEEELAAIKPKADRLDSWIMNMSKGQMRRHHGADYDKPEPGYIQPDLFELLDDDDE